MTEKQKLFCDEYLKDLNATRAYKEIYKIKNDNSARALSSKLLTNINIKNYIDQKLEELESKKIADVKEVLQYFTSVVRGESESEYVVVEGYGDGVSRATTISKTPDEKDRLKAAELLGKYHSIFKDKVDVSVKKYEDYIKDIEDEDEY
jgi:phage terminase small subunit